MKRFVPTGVIAAGLAILLVLAVAGLPGPDARSREIASLAPTPQVAGALDPERILEKLRAPAFQGNSASSASRGLAATPIAVEREILVPVPQLEASWTPQPDGDVEGCWTVDEQCRPVPLARNQNSLRKLGAAGEENSGPTLAPPELPKLKERQEVILIQIEAEQAAESSHRGQR